MPIIRYEGTKLIQSFVQDEEELGYIEKNRESGKYRLWLKDLYGFVIGKGCYVSGGTLSASSLKDAQYEALTSDSTYIMHQIWLKNKAEYTIERNWDEIDRRTEGRANKDSVLKWVLQNAGRATTNTTIKEFIEWITSHFV